MDNNQWHWQESGKAWKGVGIYHVTMVVSSREPLLGELIIPHNEPKQARVERTELGNKIVDELYHLGKVHPEIRILQFCLMPDHLHFIIHVTKPTTLSVREMIRGYWQGAKRYGREYTLSIEPELNSGPINKVNPIFTERPFIRPLSRKGQLQAMYQYVRMNPQRLATKRLMPGFFRVQESIEIAGCTYRGVGNIALLQAERYAPVHVRRTMVEEAEHGDNKRLRDYMNGCVLDARNGSVMVSPFISQQEGYIISPYMDYLSFFFNKDWRMPMENLASIMIKLADEERGGTDGKTIDKTMTMTDHKRMNEAVLLCRDILVRLGVPFDQQFLGTLNAGHPGGMLPLTATEKDSLHNPNLPENLYVADATILPKAMGNPPILTIMALARKIAGLV